MTEAAGLASRENNAKALETRQRTLPAIAYIKVYIIYLPWIVTLYKR